MNHVLKNLLAADAPTACDTAFEIAVLARIEQRRFRRGLIANAALMLAACLVLALAMPVLQSLWDSNAAFLYPLLPGSIPPLAIGLALMAASAALALLRRAD